MSIFSLTKPVKLDLHFTTLSNHNYDDLFSNLLNPVFILSFILESEIFSTTNVYIFVNENSKSFDENLNT